MKYALAAFGLMGSAFAAPQGAVTSAIAPPAPAPSGCQTTFDRGFQITVVNVTSSKRSLERRQLDGVLTATIQDGVMKDQGGRTAYIAGNNQQFQFDEEPQAGAEYTSGFSLCADSHIALGDSTEWYQCYNADGFYNLYTESQNGENCNKVYMVAVDAGGSASALPSVSGPVASQLSDGQPQAPTMPGSVLPSATGPVVSQISDYQPQVPTNPGSVLPSATGPVVSQISDGQPQVPTMPGSVLPSATGPVVSQISDGQPQVPTMPATPSAMYPTGGNYTQPGASGTGVQPPMFTGAAATAQYGMGAFAAGVVGLAALL